MQSNFTDIQNLAIDLTKARCRERSIPVKIKAWQEELPFLVPFTITGYTFDKTSCVVVELSDGVNLGRGEASGVYYLNDIPSGMHECIQQISDDIEEGITRADLRQLLPPGGARNAIDCALWDLQAKVENVSVWKRSGVNAPKPLVTTYTIPAESPAVMADGARRYISAKALKLKLTGETDLDIERVRAVRSVRPDCWIGVDANQGFTPQTLEPLVSTLSDCRVGLLEQPFARGCEADMEGLRLPLPTAADESCLHLGELELIVGRFDAINIKLDKCGGLTEGLMMVERARKLGLKVMVGNMMGSSLAMAPSFILGQLCDFVDLDGPIFLRTDRVPGVDYRKGEIYCPPEVWGNPTLSEESM